MRRRKARRPKKPRPNFPLFPHRNGSWTVVIGGKQRSFGGWASDPKGTSAYLKWQESTNAAKTGREPRQHDLALDLEEMFNQFLSDKEARVKSGDLEARTHDEYRADLAEFMKIVGGRILPGEIGPDDFSKAIRAYHAARNSPVTIAGKIGNVRSAFIFAEAQGLIEHAPRYGQNFRKPSKKSRRRAARLHEAEHGKKLIDPDLIARILKSASPTLKACVLLGLNCGFLAIDCARLNAESINLRTRWLEFIRQKTETFRAAVLWPETVKAIRAASKATAGPLFKTIRGMPLVHDHVTSDSDGIAKVRRSDSLNQAFRDLLVSLSAKRVGVNFSALRKTYRTTADEVGDRNAVMVTMGHAFAGMDEFYVRHIAKPRLLRVSEHVRRKLLNVQKVPSPTAATRRRHK